MGTVFSQLQLLPNQPLANLQHLLRRSIHTHVLLSDQRLAVNQIRARVRRQARIQRRPDLRRAPLLQRLLLHGRHVRIGLLEDALRVRDQVWRQVPLQRGPDAARVRGEGHDLRPGGAEGGGEPARVEQLRGFGDRVCDPGVVGGAVGVGQVGKVREDHVGLAHGGVRVDVHDPAGGGDEGGVEQERGEEIGA